MINQKSNNIDIKEGKYYAQIRTVNKISIKQLDQLHDEGYILIAVAADSNAILYIFRRRK